MNHAINSENAKLDWTGHPLVDAGIATLCAMACKFDPKLLTMDDLDLAAEEMLDYYSSGIMMSFTSSVFTMNAYDNPTSSQGKKQEYENRVLRAHRSSPDVGASMYRCVFSRKVATHLIERRQMPMLTGEGVINFYPSGQAALPIYGPYLVALQALPLGGRRVEGKLLVVHADWVEIMLAFSRRYLADNRRLIALAKEGVLPSKAGLSEQLEREQAAWDNQKKRPKYPDAKAVTSLVSSDLLDFWDTRLNPQFRDYPVSITVYWLSNSGQEPSLQTFFLPAQVVRFLGRVNQPPYDFAWKKIVAGGWRNPQDKDKDQSLELNGKGRHKKEVNKPIPGGPGRSRNNVLADLFSIYEHGFVDRMMARKFLRRHLLQEHNHIAGKEGLGEGKIKDPSLVDWKLLTLFMREVMGLDEKYIKKVSDFADRLAEHIDGKNDKQLFRSLVYSKMPWEMRNALAKAQRNQARERNELLFGLEDYLSVFEAEDAVGRHDWSLARDLISIRLVEQLFQKGYFQRDDNKELLDEPEKKEE